MGGSDIVSGVELPTSEPTEPGGARFMKTREDATGLLVLVKTGCQEGGSVTERAVLLVKHCFFCPW